MKLITEYNSESKAEITYMKGRKLVLHAVLPFVVLNKTEKANIF
jgi:hypothetical protein